MSPRSRIVIVGGTIAAAVALGAAVATGPIEVTMPFAAGGGPPTVASSEGALEVRLASYERELGELRRELVRGRKERSNLVAELDGLRGELARLGASAKAEAAHDSPSRSVHRRDEKKASGRPRGELDVDVLVAAGFAEHTVRAFKENIDQLELDRLYLRDIAIREGWLNTAEFREQNEALMLDTQSTREEYGEEFYDWMLYATGHPNRLEVGAVMNGSVAADVGLRPGDLIVSYGDQRIFSPTELRDATNAGSVGELIPVDFVRDGRHARMFVPRGPLGIRVQPTVTEPPSAG